ncbi:hypothetical protein HZH68_014461 [Vespula germanica]|uniref:Uncharacterized protein n=1 Tax=Vespula germanica TaxID=30212 RepID=A0A834MU28_VESGE|nr:hypothetical protein HZH68_014461 [Vespula germanica]
MKTELETWLDISDEEEHTCIYTSTEAFRDGYYVSPQAFCERLPGLPCVPLAHRPLAEPLLVASTLTRFSANLSRLMFE